LSSHRSKTKNYQSVFAFLAQKY